MIFYLRSDQSQRQSVAELDDDVIPPQAMMATVFVSRNIASLTVYVNDQICFEMGPTSHTILLANIINLSSHLTYIKRPKLRDML